MWMPCIKCENYIACWRNKEYHTPTNPCSEFKEYDPKNYQQWGIIKNPKKE